MIDLKDAAFCHTCITGLLQHKIKATNVDPAFVSSRMNSSRPRSRLRTSPGTSAESVTYIN